MNAQTFNVRKINMLHRIRYCDTVFAMACDCKRRETCQHKVLGPFGFEARPSIRCIRSGNEHR